MATTHPRQMEYAVHGTAQHHVQHPQYQSHGSMEWSSRPPPVAAQPGSAEYAPGFEHYPAGMMMVPNQPGAAAPSWNVPSGQFISARAFGRAQPPAADWHHVEARAEQEVHLQAVSQASPLGTLEAAPHPPTSAYPVTALAPMRRSGTNPKLPTVPSPFVERQKKNTISKRQGPLSKEKREKAHRMRQRGPDGKPPCIRCRFYKAGVCERCVCLNAKRLTM